MAPFKGALQGGFQGCYKVRVYGECDRLFMVSFKGFI